MAGIKYWDVMYTVHSTGEGEQSTDKGKQYRVLTKINSVTSGQAGGVFRQHFLQWK